jgi:hypothetical protein
MSPRKLIAQIFGPDAFGDALFYRIPGGLRFEMSEGGAPLEQALTALRKATEILDFIFSGQENVLICLRRFIGTNPFSVRNSLRELAGAGAVIPRKRDFWLEEVPIEDRWKENVTDWNAFVVFELPATRMQSLLWCAFTTDFPALKPNPRCSVYFIDIERKLLVHPYDDRGMDIVGLNTDLLSQLYVQFNQILLEYDRSTMDSTFNVGQPFHMESPTRPKT